MAKREGDKERNNDLQNTTQKTKDLATWTSHKTGSELRCTSAVHAPLLAPVVLLLLYFLRLPHWRHSPDHLTKWWVWLRIYLQVYQGLSILHSIGEDAAIHFLMQPPPLMTVSMSVPILVTVEVW